MRKLFPSFTGLMYALADHRVNHIDLSNGLFVFGCTRGHAINPGAFDEAVEEVVTRNPLLHAMVVRAITLAEEEGRIRWRTLDMHTSFDMVNDLLEANGEPPLVSHLEAYGREDDFPDYSYPSLMERCKTLKVVF